MKSIKSSPWLFSLIILMMVALTACSALQPAAQPAVQPTLPQPPTVDIVALHTQVAQTVVAQITVQAALNPSPTPPATSVPPTVAPTAIPPAAGMVITNTQMPTLAPPVLQTPTWHVLPTFTKTPYVDSCALQSTTPADYTIFSPGTPFEAYWVVKNTGMRPWNNRFYFTKVAGPLGYSGIIYVDPPVGQGGEYELHISMAAPNTAGTYKGSYKLVNDDGVALCQFFVVITVR